MPHRPTLANLPQASAGLPLPAHRFMLAACSRPFISCSLCSRAFSGCAAWIELVVPKGRGSIGWARSSELLQTLLRMLLCSSLCLLPNFPKMDRPRFSSRIVEHVEEEWSSLKGSASVLSTDISVFFRRKAPLLMTSESVLSHLGFFEWQEKSCRECLCKVKLAFRH